VLIKEGQREYAKGINADIEKYNEEISIVDQAARDAQTAQESKNSLQNQLGRTLIGDDHSGMPESLSVNELAVAAKLKHNTDNNTTFVSRSNQEKATDIVNSLESQGHSVATEGINSSADLNEAVIQDKYDRVVRGLDNVQRDNEQEKDALDNELAVREAMNEGRDTDLQRQKEFEKQQGWFNRGWSFVSSLVKAAE
jgi:hypothetical protein